MSMNKKKQRHFNSVRIIAFGFFLMIFLGAILLWLPISSANGNFKPPIDALFTATTSVCVTGLTTVVIATHWSVFGKIVILFLIQLGGLGVVCAGMGVAMMTKRKITMRDRMLIQTSYNLDSMDGMVKLIRKIIVGVFAVEGIGAISYAIAFVPTYGLIKGIIYGVFHSVSAFCNAGIDLVGASSFCGLRDNVAVNITTMLLIITGGIGFIVWWDLAKVIKRSFSLRRVKKQLFCKLTVHSKLVLITTFICIFGGAILILIGEYTNSSTIGELGFGKKVMSSLFESVTTRTAGFATIPQENFRETSYLFIIILMLIGGSPMGTAGGLKTTTIAMIFLSVRGTIKGKKDVETLGRKLCNDSIRAAISVLALGISVVIIAVVLLVALEPFSMKDIVFEVVSAIATVGLTRGITTELSVAGKLIIVLVMYIGRVGIITMAMAFNIKGKKKQNTNIRELAETKILIG